MTKSHKGLHLLLVGLVGILEAESLDLAFDPLVERESDSVLAVLGSSTGPATDGESLLDHGNGVFDLQGTFGNCGWRVSLSLCPCKPEFSLPASMSKIPFTARPSIKLGESERSTR